MFEDVVTGVTKGKVNIQGFANSDQDPIDDIKCILIKNVDKIDGTRIIANAGAIYANNSLGVSAASQANPQPSVPETPSKFAGL